MKWIKRTAGWPWRRRAAQEPAALGMYRAAGAWQRVQLVRAADGDLRMQAAGRLALPQAAGEARDDVLAEPESLRLQAWTAAGGVVAPVVVAGLPRAVLRLWRMEVPAGLEDADMEHMVLMEAQGRQGLSPEAWQIDFGVASQPARNGADVELLVAAAPRADVEGYRQLLHAAGLHLQVLEVAAHAARQAVMRAWRCQAGAGAGWQGIVLWEEDAVTLLWLQDGRLAGEQLLEMREWPELAAMVAHAWRTRGVALDCIWLAVDAAADEEQLCALQKVVRGRWGISRKEGELPESGVQWLHPWAAMAIDDADWRERSAAQAQGWWAVSGLALRGVDAWCC